MHELIEEGASLPDRLRRRRAARLRSLAAITIVAGVVGAVGSTTVLAATDSAPIGPTGPTSPPGDPGPGDAMPFERGDPLVAAESVAAPAPFERGDPLVAAESVAAPAPPAEEVSGALHVSSSGDDRVANRTAGAPYRTIAGAVRAAPTGATIVVHAGVYREEVVVDRPVEIVAAPGPRPWLSGADVVEHWTVEADRWWTEAPVVQRDGWTPGMIGDEPAGLVDVVAVDGSALRQVTSLAALGPGAFYVDDTTGRLWLADDPAGHTVEIARREHAFVFQSVPGARLVGIGARHYATGPGDRAAIEVRGGGVALVDVVALENANAGIQAIGPGIEMTGVEARGNGRLGVNAHHADGLTVRDGSFVGNNTEGHSFRGAAGGIKVTASRDVVVESSDASGNGGSGIWIDMSSVDVTVARNTADDNTRSGVFVEVSARAVVEANQARGNDRGIEINESNDVEVRANIVTGNTRGIFVVDGHRDGRTCVDRGLAATFTAPVDSRHGCQWPTVKWDIDRVEITGNTLVDGNTDDTERAMLEVNHVAHPEGAIDGVDRRKPAAQMNVTLSGNRYRRSDPTLPRWVVAWTRGSSVAAFETQAEFEVATGHAG